MLRSARFLWFLSLVVGLALSTWTFGWGAVVVLAAAWTWIRRGDAAVPVLAASAAAVSWGLLLGIQSLTVPIGRVAEVVGTAMQVGPASLIVLTLAFAALLAGATSGLVRGLGNR
jgi:hypothetical protein